MFTSIPGWNVDPTTGERMHEISTEDRDLSLITAVSYLKKRKAGTADGVKPAGIPDDSARAGTRLAATDKV